MSNFTKVSDLHDPEVLEKLIGEAWLNNAKVVTRKIMKRIARKMQGTLVSDVRQKTFQDSKGQVLKAGDEISAINKTPR